MIHFSAIIHHTGVSLTHKALRHWGFDHSATCEIAARNLWCDYILLVLCDLWSEMAGSPPATRFARVHWKRRRLDASDAAVQHDGELDAPHTHDHPCPLLHCRKDPTLRSYPHGWNRRTLHRFFVGRRHIQTYPMAAEALRPHQPSVSCPVHCFVCNIACVLVVVRDIGRDEDTTLHHRLLCLLRYLNDAILLVLHDPSMVLQKNRS